MMSAIKQYLWNLLTFPSLSNVWIQKLVAVLAFWPHKPSYDLIVGRRKDGAGKWCDVYKFCLNKNAKKILRSFKYYKYKDIVDKKQDFGFIKPFMVTTSRGNRVFAVKIDPIKYLTRKGEYDDPYTIVYSHSNGCDLGVIIGSLWRLAKKCQCTVVAYDYSGYGRSSGKPSERNMYADIEAVVKELVQNYYIPSNTMIMYGESIGSAAALDLARRMWVAGVILHAPLKSGIRTYYNYGKRSWFFDPFPNLDHVERVEAPVLVIHGMKDTIIDISHGLSLHHMSRYKVTPLWLRDANHSDVRTYPPYFKRIALFFKDCDRYKYCRGH